jgi:hypothetical protein
MAHRWRIALFFLRDILANIFPGIKSGEKSVAEPLTVGNREVPDASVALWSASFGAVTVD